MKNFLTIAQTGFAVIAITAFVFIACNRGASQSTASNEAQTQFIDTEEGFDAGFDPSGIADDLWFAAADTGLKVTIATQEILNQYENYITYINDYESAIQKIIFISENAIDMEFLAIRVEYIEREEKFYYLEDASLASSIIRSDRPFVVNWMEAGIYPYRAIAFYDKNGVKRYFAISGNAAGEGAPVLLYEYQARHFSAADLNNTTWKYESGSGIYFLGINTTFEFIANGKIVHVYHVNEDHSYNNINSGTWDVTAGNKFIINGEPGLSGMSERYGYTFFISGDTLIITDHNGETAVFKKIEAHG